MSAGNCNCEMRLQRWVASLQRLDAFATVGCTAVNPWITNVPTMVAFSIVPFNVISFGVTSILAMLLYKKISVPLKKFAMIG